MARMTCLHCGKLIEDCVNNACLENGEVNYPPLSNNQFTRIGTFCEKCRSVICICNKKSTAMSNEQEPMTAEEFLEERKLKDTIYNPSFDIHNNEPEWIKGGLSKLLNDYATLRVTEATREMEKRIEELESALERLIKTSTLIWDDVKNIKDTQFISVTHPIIEESKQLLTKKP